MQYIEYNPNTLNIVGARRNPELNPKSTKFDFQYWVDKELSLNTARTSFLSASKCNVGSASIIVGLYVPTN